MIAPPWRACCDTTRNKSTWIYSVHVLENMSRLVLPPPREINHPKYPDAWQTHDLRRYLLFEEWLFPSSSLSYMDSEKVVRSNRFRYGFYTCTSRSRKYDTICTAWRLDIVLNIPSVSLNNLSKFLIRWNLNALAIRALAYFVVSRCNWWYDSSVRMTRLGLLNFKLPISFPKRTSELWRWPFLPLDSGDWTPKTIFGSIGFQLNFLPFPQNWTLLYCKLSFKVLLHLQTLLVNRSL